MSPGGHLLTTVAAGGAAAALTGSLELTAGLAAGGFLIDLDHALDYLLVEGQRDLRPRAFLRYYLEGRTRRAVLALHSWELFAVLAVLAWRFDWPLLTGYLAGALMHLALDLAFNGEHAPHSIVAFYSFGYRLAHRFDARVLLGPAPRPVAPGFWRPFFSLDLHRERLARLGRRQPVAAGAPDRADAPLS